MKHYRTGMIIRLIAITLLGILCGWLLAQGFWAPAVLVAVPVTAVIWSTLRLAWTPIRVTADFVTALEMNDGSARFDFGNGNDEIKTICDSMNRTLAFNGRMRLELETSKIYYDRILKVMTHEMRNAITPVLALSDDILTNTEGYDAEHLSECVTLIREQSAGIKRFLEAYYTLTHLPPLQPETIDSALFWNSLRELCSIETRQRGLPEKTVTFTVATGMTLCADSPLLRQALMNLIRNALDAVSGESSPYIEVTAAMNGEDTVGITVSDNGTGIPNNVKPMLFQPFFSTKSGGSGVGLCLARQIARLHGGDITLLSNTSRGTTFIMTLQRTHS